MFRIRKYAIAWKNLMIVLRNGYSLDSWIAPIPKEHKTKMLEAGKRFIAHEKARKTEPSLF